MPRAEDGPRPRRAGPLTEVGCASRAHAARARSAPTYELDTDAVTAGFDRARPAPHPGFGGARAGGARALHLDSP
jgi:hypothetical protein